MISFATQKNREDIIRLWKEAFGDSTEAIECFLDNICKDRVAVFTENNKAVGMASVLPVSCNGKTGRYIYAVATDKAYRGRGICKKLMAYIEGYAKEQRDSFLILVPASSSLFDFYKKMGYNQEVFAPILKAEDTDKVISHKEYYKLRKSLLKGYDFISWGEAELEFILSHGKAVKTPTGIAYFENGKAIEVINDVMDKAEAKPFALIKYIDNIKFKKLYFGLAMS